MKLILLFVATTFVVFSSVAQEKKSWYTISGYVQDISSEEKIIGANLYVEKNQKGASTNKYGYFSITVKDTEKVTVSHVSYEASYIIFTSKKDTAIVIRLTPKTNELNAVTVQESSGKDTYDDPTMGKFVIPIDLLKRAPALLGEVDVLKTIQLLPGVQAGTEGTVGLNVRGGSPDQNLVLLDGMTLYNLNHLFGFFSVINTDAVAQAEFLKGSIPARYGGRLSSVLDISLREGNMREWKGNAALSPIAGRLLVEGPIKKDVSSVLISARRTWLDALYWLGSKLGGSKSINGYGFYDINAKINYKLSNTDRVYLSFYTGKDKFSNNLQLSDSRYTNTFDWGNQTVGLRWNHIYGKRLFANTTINYSHFQYELSEELRSNRSYVNRVSSGISDLSAKMQFDWYVNSNHSVQFGVGAMSHSFRPEIKQFVASTADTTYQPTALTKTGELSAYVEDDWVISRRVRASIGIHYANQLVSDRLWQSYQPRLTARYVVGQRSSVKASYNRMTQFLHLLTNSSVGLPTDLWVPVTDKVAPENAHWWSLGYSNQLSNQWNMSIETYYKSMYNVLDYKEGASFQNNFSTPWYDRIAVGTGTAYGAEFYVEKSTGKTRGWASYTLSWANRQFTDINGGRSFPYKYDRRHNIALVVSHDFTKNKSLSANFVYSSGSALTLAQSRYEGQLPGGDLLNKGSIDISTYRDIQFFSNLPDLQERNNFRTPAYHRLDISYRTSKQKIHGIRTWIISCYNLYNRLNPFFLFYDRQQLKQFSLFPAIPSLTYQYDF